MRILTSLLAIGLMASFVSCTTHDRQQYSYSYKKPVHTEKSELSLPPRTDIEPPSASIPPKPAAAASNPATPADSLAPATPALPAP